MFKRTIDKTLSFKGERLLRDRHKIHPFPAMLHPLLADSLIKSQAKENDVIFDPFCGSGVTLLQAGLANHKSIGFDINPLALLISRVKTSHYEIGDLRNTFKTFKQDLMDSPISSIPPIKNINHWYSAETQNDLGRIRRILIKYNYNYHDLFQVCFAHICRHQSLTRKNEFKRYRIQQDKIKDIDFDVFGALFSHIESIINTIEKTQNPAIAPDIYLKNSENTIDKSITYDLVITSPPYGDSPTTVAYGQYCSFGLEWTKGLIGIDDIDYNVDRECIGKVSEIDDDIYNSKSLRETLGHIKGEDKKRSMDVLHFFNGYYKSLKNITANLNHGGRLVFIVGNRTVKGYQIPMDQITSEFLNYLGMDFRDILVRDILNKTMPLRNSPTNIAGEHGNTMKNEYIIMFDKP